MPCGSLYTLGAVLRSTLLRWPLAAVAMGAIGSSGCRDLTSVDAPDVVQPDDYATAAGATALAAGAITRFHAAFGSGNGSSQVLLSGLLADELTQTFAEDHPVDRRDIHDPSPDGSVYELLQDARQQLLTAIGHFQEVAPDSSLRIGQLFALLGYTSALFGESYCAGVPLGHRDADLQPVYGQPLPTAQLFDSALAALDSALVYAADDSRIVNLALVGRGRALLNQGLFSEAAEVVTSVPTDYSYDVTYVTGTLHNGLFSLDEGGSILQVGITVSDREGANGLNWRTAGDPRLAFVPHIQSSGDTAWQSALYQAADAPIRLASGFEARLIEAEAALQAGDVQRWLALHNMLRATVAGLAPLSDPGAAGSRVDLHFRERAFWLFLTGHRLGDLRRIVRQYGRDPESVFPTGEWRNGIPYGTATSMTPSTSQLANPHYSGCLSREA